MPRGGGQDLPHARRLSTAKAPRHGARAKGFVPRGNALLGEGLPTQRTSERICPRENAPLGEGLPTRRTGERICPAQKHSPRRRPPDTAHGRKDLPRAGTLPRRRPLETAHERKDLSHAGTLSSAKASRHGARAKGFAPRRSAPHGEGLPTRRTGEKICPSGFTFAPRADERRAAPDRRTAGKTPLRRGRTHSARPLPSSFT